VLLAELVEKGDHQLADAIALVGGAGASLLEQQLERPFMISGFQRRKNLRLLPGFAKLRNQALACPAPSARP